MSARHSAELAQAEHLVATGKGVLARALLLPMLQRAPHLLGVHRVLAIEALGSGDAPRALLHAQRAADLAPHDAFVAMLLGRAYKASGQADAAAQCYRHAITLDPSLAAAHVSLGITLKAQGDLLGAMACYRRALVLEPQFSAAQSNLGVALAQLQPAAAAHDQAAGPGDEALVSLRAAVHSDPGDAAARHNLGVALAAAGRNDEAVDVLNATLAMDTTRRDTCRALHGALTTLHFHEGARDCCERWLALNPLDAEIANRLVATLLLQGDLDAAAQWLERALPLAPDIPELRHNFGNLLQQSLRVSDALTHLRHAIEMSPSYVPAWQTLLMCLNYVSEDPAPIAHMHRRFGQLHGQAQGQRRNARASARVGPQRLRVGWVSGDFRRHSVAYFVEALFEAHDRERFEWVAYDNGRREDQVTQRLKAHCSAWVKCAALSDQALAQRIRADGIDILVDLGGHTADSGIAVFNQRPAPVQMSYLGYPTTTGMASIDHRLTDGVIDRPGDERWSVERLLRFEHGMFCYRPDHDASDDAGDGAGASEVAPLPALQRGHITFGSFNNLAKLSPATVVLWSQVLHAVPGSRLLLKAMALSVPSVQQRLLRQFAAQGIAAERLLLKPWRADPRSHLDLYHEVDIALDTFPFNGATTSCEALWMGVPVVSLTGATHVSRMGASILRSAGLPEWATTDARHFVELARARAADLAGLASLRAALRSRLRASALLDAPAHARQLEALLLQAHAGAAATAVGSR